MSIENLALALVGAEPAAARHFRHFSSLFTNLHLYICREPSTNQLLLCKTNPILSAVGGLQMNVNILLQKAYENIANWTIGESKPNSNPIQTQSNPICLKAKMDVTLYVTKDYEGNDIFAVPENKPNSNPNKPNFRILSRQILSGQAFIRSGQAFVAQIHRTDTVRLISRNADGNRIGGGQFQPNDQRIGPIRVNYHALANVT